MKRITISRSFMIPIVCNPPLPHKQNPRCLYQQKQTGIIFLSEAEMKLNPQTPSLLQHHCFFSPSPSPNPIFLVHIQTWPWNLKQLIHDSDSRKNSRFVVCFVFSPPRNIGICKGIWKWMKKTSYKHLSHWACTWDWKSSMCGFFFCGQKFPVWSMFGS